MTLSLSLMSAIPRWRHLATKKISINNLLSSSPTATGALTVTGLVTAGSATITGAATVGTTLGVTGVSTLTGAVGVGATPIGKFDVYAVASDTNIFIRSDTTRLGQIVFRDNADAGNQGIVRYDHLNDRLSFTANGADNLYLLSTGDLSVTTGNVVMATSGKGIDFSATTSGSGTMTSELLNDYEEGTFTPTIIGTSPAGTATYSVQIGRYTKVGRVVQFSIDINYSAGSGGGYLQVAGLPFQNSNNLAVLSTYPINIALAASYYAVALIGTNSTVIDINQLPTGGGNDAVVNYDGAGRIILSGTYTV